MKNKMKLNNRQVMQDAAYVNKILGTGTDLDKIEHTKVAPYVPADIDALNAMVANDGVADCVCTIVPESAFREDIAIVGDNGGEILKEYDEKGLKMALIEAGEIQRIEGGSIIVTMYDGSTKIDTPPRPSEKITGYRVFGAGDLELKSEDFVKDVPRLYRVVMLDQSTVSIDPSRVTVFKGKRLSRRFAKYSLREAFFGRSFLQVGVDDLKSHAGTKKAVANMAHETGTVMAALDGLNEMRNAKNEKGNSVLIDFLTDVKLAMNNMRMAIVGSTDKLEILNHNFTGLPEILREQKGDIAADYHIPASILFERTATGLSQNNDADIQAYSEYVDNWRRRYMYKPACTLIKDLAQRNLNKAINEFTWGAVHVMSLLETLNAKKIQSETLKNYYDVGSIDSDTIHDAVFKNGHSWEVITED